jgi:lysophospholipase L1-like esterase
MLNARGVAHGWMGRVMAGGVVGLAALAICEAGLRCQQWMGPVVDLEPHGSLAVETSDILNHKPPPGPCVTRLLVRNSAGKSECIKYQVIYDENGIKRSRLRPSDPRNGVQALFMGDSFMEGYDDANTIPQHAYRFAFEHGTFPGNPVFLNAGFSSYSPSILIVQARQLIPLLRPEFIVVDIDETDLLDDGRRYRDLVVRDAAGRITRVGYSEEFNEYARSVQQSTRHILYLVRLVHRAYAGYGPAGRRLRERESQFAPDHMLDCSRREEAEARKIYAREIAIFEANVKELCETLVGCMPDTRRILFVHHPHLGHLMRDVNGRTWNHIVSETVARQATAHGIRFYDAEADLLRECQGHPENYYWPDDMHFNFKGVECYGNLVGRELAALVAASKGSR